MTATPISDGLNKGLIEKKKDYEECDHCGGKMGYVQYNTDKETHEFDHSDEPSGIKLCKDCHTTPNGNLLDVDENHADDVEIYSWPYEKCSKDEDAATYSTYSVRLGKKPAILNGGFEAAYRNPANGQEYCLEKYGENPHHDGLIIWG